MEPPSQELDELLTRLRLATARDLRRCRPLVRRLARDLPTFDSVWIDALTQNRVLTPFQARLLESDHPERLQVGPCVLVDEWERDGHWTLCVARHQGSLRKCLLTYVNVSNDELPRARDGVRELIPRLRGVTHPSIIVPQGCDVLNERLVVVSPYAAGPTLQQLLVRRGRFPIPVVREIARQLLDGLSALEGCQVVHGDLRLNSIRLTRRGQTILLNPGVLPAVGRRVSIHDAIPADGYDGTAPELISTGQTARLRSDLYALGCLLWQLLAGRPPFPTGDPLGKLASHQSRPIDDVRRWRPDTPPELAAVIAKLTQKDPAARPSGPREVRDTLRLGPRSGRRGNLASFHASFGAVARRHGDSYRSASRFPWPVAAMLLFVMGGISLSLLDAGARNELLRLANRTSEPVAADTSLKTHRTAMTGEVVVQPLPTAPIDGVIVLDSAGPFQARDIQTDRPLTIRSTAGAATILVGDQPLRINAQSLQMSGIRFVVSQADRDAANAASGKKTTLPPILLAVRSQQITLDHCQFEVVDGTTPSTAIAWKVADEADPNGGRFVARHTTFTGACRALDVHAMPRVIGFDNCLKRGNGPFVRLMNARRTTPLRVHLRQSTLRDTGPIIQWTQTAAADAIQPALVVVEDSVFALQPESIGLLDFAGPPPSGWMRLLQITGEGSLLHPATPLATSQSSVVDASSLRVEGLIIDDFEFASEEAGVAASEVAATQAPRSTATPPGIDPSRFALKATPPVVRQTAHEYNAQ